MKSSYGANVPGVLGEPGTAEWRPGSGRASAPCPRWLDSWERSHAGNGPGVPRAEPPFMWAPRRSVLSSATGPSSVPSLPAAVSLPPRSVDGVGVCGMGHEVPSLRQGQRGLQRRASQLRQRGGGSPIGNSLCSLGARRRCGVGAWEKVWFGPLDSRRGCSWPGRSRVQPLGRQGLPPRVPAVTGPQDEAWEAWGLGQGRAGHTGGARVPAWVRGPRAGVARSLGAGAALTGLWEGDRHRRQRVIEVRGSRVHSGPSSPSSLRASHWDPMAVSCSVPPEPWPEPADVEGCRRGPAVFHGAGPPGGGPRSPRRAGSPPFQASWATRPLSHVLLVCFCACLKCKALLSSWAVQKQAVCQTWPAGVQCPPRPRFWWEAGSADAGLPGP